MTHHPHLPYWHACLLACLAWWWPSLVAQWLSLAWWWPSLVVMTHHHEEEEEKEEDWMGIQGQGQTSNRGGLDWIGLWVAIIGIVIVLTSDRLYLLCIGNN